MAFDHFRKRLLALKPLSKDIQLSISQLHRLIADEKIKAVKIGYRATRIDGDSLADFLESRQITQRQPRGKHLNPKAAESATQA